MASANSTRAEFLRAEYAKLMIIFSSFAVFVASPDAFADGGSNMSLVSKSQSQTSAPPYMQLANAPQASIEVRGAVKRMEYRYPDQPNIAYGKMGPRHLGKGSNPLAFSSSNAVVSTKYARKVSFSKENTKLPRSRQSGILAKKAPKGYAQQKVGAPYEIAGRWYVPFEEPAYDEVGVGSWYGPKFHGKPTATGEVFDQNALTAAHPTLPIPSLARVTNLENGRSLVVRINDRGPFIDDRIIDLSRKAADILDYQGNGTAKVRIQYMGFAPEKHNSVPSKYVAEARNLEASKSIKPIGLKSLPKLARKMTGTVLSPNRSSDSQIVLQVGAFRELSNAHALRAKLHVYGRSYVKESLSNGREIFKVYIESKGSSSDAILLKDRVSRDGFDAILIAG